MGAIDLLLFDDRADSATGFDLFVKRFVECEVKPLVGEISLYARSHQFFLNCSNSIGKSCLFDLKLNILWNLGKIPFTILINYFQISQLLSVSNRLFQQIQLNGRQKVMVFNQDRIFIMVLSLS